MTTYINIGLFLARLAHHPRVSVVPPPPEFQSAHRGSEQQQQRPYGDHPPDTSNSSKGYSQGKGSPRPVQQGTQPQPLAASILQTPAAPPGPSNWQQTNNNNSNNSSNINISNREEQMVRQQQRHLQRQQHLIQQQLQQGGVVLVLNPEGMPSRVDPRQISQGGQATTTPVNIRIHCTRDTLKWLNLES